jgi:hypothetical protein
MYKLKNSLIAFGGLSLFIGAISLVTPHPTPAQGSDSVGTKPISVVNTPIVRVGNPPGAPLPVRDVDNPARQPVHTNVLCIANSMLGCDETIYTVPAGKRLVIEYASMLAEIPVGQVASWTISTFVRGRLERHRFPLTLPSVAFNNVTATESGQQVRIYADPGTHVEAGGIPNSGSGPFTFTISGHLVDVP